MTSLSTGRNTTVNYYCKWGFLKSKIMVGSLGLPKNTYLKQQHSIEKLVKAQALINIALSIYIDLFLAYSFHKNIVK